MATAKKNHTAAEKRAAEARASLAIAQENHTAASDALAAAEQAKANARAGAAAGTASGADIAAAAADVEAARLRVDATEAELAEATKLETAAVAEYHAVQLAGGMASVVGPQELREQIAAAVVPAITTATESVLTRNRQIAQAKEYARKAGLREGQVDPFSPIMLDATGQLIVHGELVPTLDPADTVLPAAKDGVAAALVQAGFTPPAELQPKRPAPTLALGATERDGTLTLAVAMLTENLPGVTVETVADGDIVTVPQLEPGQTLIRVGRPAARKLYSGPGVNGSVTIAVYHTDQDSQRGAVLDALPTARRSSPGSGTAFSMGAVYTKAGRFLSANSGHYKRITLGSATCDVVRLTMEKIDFTTTEPPTPQQPAKTRGHIGVREYAPGHLVHVMDYDPRA